MKTLASPPAVAPAARRAAEFAALLLLLIVACLPGCATPTPPALPVNGSWRFDEHGWHRDAKPRVRLRFSPDLRPEPPAPSEQELEPWQRRDLAAR